MCRRRYKKTLLFILMIIFSPSIVAATYLVENSTWEAELTGIQWVSQTWGDVDNDNDLDLAVIGCTSLDGSSCDGYLSKIYINNGTSLVDDSD